MALQGSLDDFNILNILQMIKLEGKTGRLTLTEGDDTVKITFDNGSIIYAEGVSGNDEARIEGVLLSNGLIDPHAWQEIKKEHENNLKPYWELLAKKISGQLLVELIRRQVVDTVYYALRWKKGNYDVAQMKNLKYNSKIMSPIDVDALLMEGCRIADEWPRIASKVPLLGTFIVKNIMDESEEGATEEMKAQTGSGSDFATSIEYEILTARGVTLNESEIAVLSIIGRGKTIQEIIYSARQGSFDTLNSLQKLLQLGLVKPSKKKEKAAARTGNVFQLVMAIVLMVIVGGGFVWQGMMWPKILDAQKSGVAKVRRIQAQAGLKKINHGMKIYFGLNKKAPESLASLAKAGILKQADLMDPWNNEYQLSYKGKRHALYSSGQDAFLATDNVHLVHPGQ